jgi:hypothetical protein
VPPLDVDQAQHRPLGRAEAAGGTDRRRWGGQKGDDARGRRQRQHAGGHGPPSIGNPRPALYAPPMARKGSRFAKMTRRLAARKGVRNSKALAAHIGRQKLGKKGMARRAAAGRRKARRSR